jgi:hypothetical protein
MRRATARRFPHLAGDRRPKPHGRLASPAARPARPADRRPNDWSPLRRRVFRDWYFVARHSHLLEAFGQHLRCRILPVPRFRGSCRSPGDVSTSPDADIGRHSGSSPCPARDRALDESQAGEDSIPARLEAVQCRRSTPVDRAANPVLGRVTDAVTRRGHRSHNSAFRTPKAVYKKPGVLGTGNCIGRRWKRSQGFPRGAHL